MGSLKISKLFIYPIKSMGGISMQASRVLPKGLAFDRRWMLIDNNHRFLTQREHSILAKFKLGIDVESSTLDVTFEKKSLIIPKALEGQQLLATVWDDEVAVVEVSNKVSHWFSERMPMPCKLVFFPEGHPRSIEATYSIPGSDQTSLSDGYPILMVGEASLNDLNTRLKEAVPINRFRPNLVFTGGLPYQEDLITQFSINNLLFAGVKPCARCVMTTIDQTSGIAGKEPLKTLAGYRNQANKVLFGQNVIPLGTGDIAVGDELVVI